MNAASEPSRSAAVLLHPPRPYLTLTRFIDQEEHLSIPLPNKTSVCVKKQNFELLLHCDTHCVRGWEKCHRRPQNDCDIIVRNGILR